MTATHNLLAALAQATKTGCIAIWPSSDNYSFGRIGQFELFTDHYGDYLLVSCDGAEQMEVLHVRDFILHGYNLADQAGRAAVREYLRRKLKAAAAKAEAQDLEAA